MEYNVENLFDTLHESSLHDEEFTPNSQRHWNSARYWAKLSRLAQTIVAVSGTTPIDMVVLCEVENARVIEDLIQHTLLARLDYQYCITDSRDERGVNVAILYQEDSFGLLSVDTCRIAYYPPKERPTRDILHVTGRIISGDTLDVFAVHLPSRRGGHKMTGAYRLRANQRIFREVKQVNRQRKTPCVIVSGDFNAPYPSKSLTRGLQVHLPKVPYAQDSLYLLTAKERTEQGVRGTYFYQGEWTELDQLVVNGHLLVPTHRCHTLPDAKHIVDLPLLCEHNPFGGVKPFRTYLGNFYHGGYSDHFPLLLTLFIRMSSTEE